jgi:hypothetical protein
MDERGRGGNWIRGVLKKSIYKNFILKNKWLGMNIVHFKGYLRRYTSYKKGRVF